MAAYLVVETDWKDTPLETRTAFGNTARPVIASYEGRFLTLPGRAAESIEGDWHPATLAIVEFPNAERIRTMVASPEFGKAVAIRRATNAEFKLVLVDANDERADLTPAV